MFNILFLIFAAVVAVVIVLLLKQPMRMRAKVELFNEGGGTGVAGTIFINQVKGENMGS